MDLHSAPLFGAAITAFLAGLIGSGHCVGMCGPIASLSGISGHPGKLQRTLLFNFGRLTSYACFGALVAGIAAAVETIAPMQSLGHWLRLAMAAILLVVGLQLLLPRHQINPLERLGAKLWRKVSPLAARLRSGHRMRQWFGLGLVWGWLPCGLVYSMFALAATSANPAGGATIMLAFGMGTLPAMLATGTASSAISRLRTGQARRFVAILMLASSAWLAYMPLQHIGADSQAHGHHHHAASIP